MKHKLLALIFTAVAVLGITSSAAAQRNVSMAIERDPILEADAKHNLDVARNAYRLKKAYKGVLMRFEETYAAYPEFSRIDEFLYIAGMASYTFPKARAIKRSIRRPKRTWKSISPPSSKKMRSRTSGRSSINTPRANIAMTLPKP